MIDSGSLSSPMVVVIVVIVIFIVATFFKSIYSIGPTQIGLVRKRFGAKLPGNNPVAFNGEAGYQAELLMPGLRFKLVLVYDVTKHPWVQVPAGQIGVVIAQVGEPTPIGAKSGVYKPEFGNFSDLKTFVTRAGRRACKGRYCRREHWLPFTLWRSWSSLSRASSAFRLAKSTGGWPSSKAA